MGLALYPTKRIYIVLAIASLTAGLAYLFLRFNDYLEANAQGICWAEGRRLAPEELRIRAIKTLILKEKEALDDWNKRSYKQNSYWRVIKRDVDEHELLALRQSYPDFPQDFGERDVEKTIARLFGMDDVNPMQLDKIYTIKHTTNVVRAKITSVLYRLDISHLHRETGVTSLVMNEIGRVTLRTTTPLFYDEYRRNRTTGSFILVDEATNTTVAAGMILAPTGV